MIIEEHDIHRMSCSSSIKSEMADIVCHALVDYWVRCCQRSVTIATIELCTYCAQSIENILLTSFKYQNEILIAMINI